MMKLIIIITFLHAVLQLCDSQTKKCGAPYTCKLATECISSLRRPQERVYFKCSTNGLLKVCCPPPENIHSPLPLDIRALNYTSHPNYHLLSGRCGQLSETDRITSGQNASLGQFPWMVLLGYQGSAPNSTVYLCGGTIISSRHILTAAHCVSSAGPQLKSVRLGEVNLSSNPDCEDYCADTVVDRQIEKVVLHRNYNEPSLKNDIALIKVTTAIPYTDYIRPICLPFDSFNSTGKRVKYEIAGWGKQDFNDKNGSTVLQFATVTLTPTEECSLVQAQEVQPLSNITQMCAGGLGADACKGDSGGPLMRVTNDGTSIKVDEVGIVSFRSREICGPDASVYTRVEGFLEWILDNID